MKRAYVVTGVESAGHRMVAGYLTRAGCWGKASTVQPVDRDLPPDQQDLMVIRHTAGLRKTIETLKVLDYTVRALVCVRDHYPHVQSLVARRHALDPHIADALIQNGYCAIFETLRSTYTRYNIVPYSSVVRRPHQWAQHILKDLELSTDTLDKPLDIDGDRWGAVPYDGDSKWYTGTPDPPHRITYEGELVWYAERGFGYYPVQDHLTPYDQNYWAKYEGYAETPIGRALNTARWELVGRHVPSKELVVDVGIGCGTFIEDRLFHTQCPTTEGYDVNPVAVGWLKARDLWKDPYVEPVPHVTCWDSLEHIPDPSALVSRVSGFMFISIPIFRGPEHVLESRHFRKDEHFWYFTRDGLVDWMASQGFELVEENDHETRAGREDIGSFAFQRTR